MTYMNAPMPQDQVVPLAESAADASFAPATRFRLRRMGGRPLSFMGSEIGMAMSFTPEVPYWYEINLYHTTEQTFVLAIRLFFQSEDQRDQSSAWAFETLHEALDMLEGYDAADDVRLDIPLDSAEMSGPELAACAMDLRARAVSARHHFSGLVGEFLHQLDGV